MTAPTGTPARRKAARWRKAKGIYWGQWELWRGESRLAYVHECRLRGGGSAKCVAGRPGQGPKPCCIEILQDFETQDTMYLWVAVGRNSSGQAVELRDAKKAARYAIEHAEVEASIAELISECGDS